MMYRYLCFPFCFKKISGFVISIVLLATPCLAIDVKLSWDSNDDASYYIVYWGEKSGDYTGNSEQIPSETTAYTVLGLENKQWFFAVKAFNDCGNSSDFSDEVSNEVTPDNVLPKANAGADQSVKEGASVILSGTDSSDGDGSIVSYVWVKTEGPDLEIVNSDSATANFQAPMVDANTKFVFTLEVVDNQGGKDTDTCEVIVADEPDILPVADAGNNVNVTEKVQVILDGSGSSDTDGSIVTYTWTQKTGPSVVLSDLNSVNPSFLAPEVDASTQLVFSLRVTDDDQLVDDDECIITVLNEAAESSPPVASAVSPVSALSGATVALDGTGSYDQGGSIREWRWIQTSGKEVTLSGANSPTPEFIAPDVTIKGEKLGFTLTVVDDDEETNSDSCTITIARSSSIYTVKDNAPSAPFSLIAEVGEKPSIEVFDRDFNHYAWLKTGWSEYNSLSGEARVVSGDIDGDGLDEVIIGLAAVDSHADIPGGYFEVLDDDYSHLAWGRVNWDEYNGGNGETWPACGDLDNDGKDEIIIGLGTGGEGALEVFKYTGGNVVHDGWIIVAWEEYNLAVGEARPVCGDIDGDGKDEIIVGLGKIGEYFENEGRYNEIIDDNREHLAWVNCGWEEYDTINGETWPACGDIFGSGLDAIAVGFGKGGNGKIELFDFSTGEAVHVNWLNLEWPDYNALSGEARPVFGNVDDDVMEEIIVGLGPVYPDSQIPGGIFQVFDDDLTLLKSAQIMWNEFNESNGESRPVRSSVKNNEKILIGLGNTETLSDESLETGVAQKITASESGASGGSCFMISVF